MTQDKKKKRHIGHGECNFFEVGGIPSTAKKVKPSQDQIYNGAFFKVANSETTGNHHLVKLTEDVELYEDTDGTLYLRNLNQNEISCVDSKRHDTIELPASTWKLKPSKEVDHLTQMKRNVAD